MKAISWDVSVKITLKISLTAYNYIVINVQGGKNCVTNLFYRAKKILVKSTKFFVSQMKYKVFNFKYFQVCEITYSAIKYP